MDNLLSSIQSVLTTTPSRWSSLTSSVTAEFLARPPVLGEWSALECLQHLVDTERWVFPARVQAFLTDQDFQAFDPDRQGTKLDPQRPATELAAEFAQLRTASLATFALITPSDLSRRARHSELGEVTLSELIHEWAAHDLMHTVQAERALMQPFIQGCGPWQSYFADHMVEH